MSLIQILSRAPVQSIDEAIAIMMAIDESLPDSDGVKWFNRLYLRVTVSVGAAVAGARFNDAAFLTMLDVVFANLYFSALAACVDRHRRGAVGMAAAVAGTEHSRDRPYPVCACRNERAHQPRSSGRHRPVVSGAGRRSDRRRPSRAGLRQRERHPGARRRGGQDRVHGRCRGRRRSPRRPGRRRGGDVESTSSAQRRVDERDRCSGACAASRACATGSSTSSTAWLAWQGAACSCRAIPPSSGSLLRT